MKVDRDWIAHQERPAQSTHVRVDCGFERDLGSDAGGVSRCNGDTRQRHGSASVSGAPAYNGGPAAIKGNGGGKVRLVVREAEGQVRRGRPGTLGGKGLRPS